MKNLSNKTSQLSTPKKTTAKKAASVADIVVHRSKKKINVPLLTEENVPAGTYQTVITAVRDAITEKGKPAADVTYCFTASDGYSTEATVRYPIGGYHLAVLMDDLLNAGLAEGSSLTESVGIQQVVNVTYPYEGALGSIQYLNQCSETNKRPRPPVKSMSVDKVVNVDDEDEDDDFDDYLDDQDE